MLHQLLREIESAQGSLNLNELAHKLNIERSALEGMIQFWVRKGRLKDDSQTVMDFPGCSSSSACGHACPGAKGCPFVMTMPRTYSLRLEEK